MFESVKVWTDGGCNPNPGIGGWSYVASTGAGACGFEAQTTNNRMEILAVLGAIEDERFADTPLIVVSDSRYVIDALTKGWLKGWQRRGWQRKDGPLKNTDLWQRMAASLIGRDLNFEWTRGHAGDHMNEAADKLTHHARATRMVREAFTLDALTAPGASSGLALALSGIR